MHPNYAVHQEQGKVVLSRIIAQRPEFTPVQCDVCVPPDTKNESHFSISESLQASSAGRGCIKVFIWDYYIRLRGGGIVCGAYFIPDFKDFSLGIC